MTLLPLHTLRVREVFRTVETSSSGIARELPIEVIY